MAEERRDRLDDLGLNYIDHSVRVNKRDRVCTSRFEEHC